MISLVLPSRDTYDHGAVDTPPVGRRFPGSRRVDLLVLAGLAVAAFAVQGLAWPLAPGRDVQSYLTYYLEMGSADPVFPQNMLLRTPLAPLFNGLALDLGGTVAAEALMGVLYVAAVLATYLIGSFWSRSAGLASGLTILLYPGYGAMFHQVSSDALFAFGLVVWAVFICRTAASPTGRKFALNGLALFLLVMIRPPAALLLPVFAAFPFLVGGRMRERLRNATVFLVTAGALLAGWAGYNDLRYGDFTISRLSAAQLPLYRALEVDRIVDPGNGPASRDLARALETDLLRREPYKSYGITLDEFLQVANGGWSDLPSLSDRAWGWHKGYGKLRAVALEAIARHPVTYARGVVNTVRQQLTAPFFPPAPQAPPPPRTIECEFRCAGPGLKHINGRLLPAPVEEGELVPHHFAFWHESTPDNSIRTDWSSFARPKLVFKHPDVEARYERLAAELREMMSKLPSRDGSRTWSARLNTITGRLPSMLVWLALGILGVALRPQRQPRLLILLAMLGLAVVVGTALGSPSAALYRLPTDPLYIVFGLAALVGSGPGVRPWVKRFVRPRRGLGHTSVGAR
jgi:hypothetical protein